MTPSDFIATLLMMGLRHLQDDDNDGDFEFKIADKQFHAHLHPDFRPVWRYQETRPFDIGAVVLVDKRVLVLYEGKEPNHSRWEHYYMFNDPKEALDFIRGFLQKHP